LNIESTDNYRELLEATVRENSNEPVELIFVDDISEWCAQREGENKSNPLAKAIRDRESRVAGILIRKNMDSERIDSVKGRIQTGGFGLEVEQLDTPERFLTHLVLHELAHLINDWGQDMEDKCDEWAFQRMEIISV